MAERQNGSLQDAFMKKRGILDRQPKEPKKNEGKTKEELIQIRKQMLKPKTRVNKKLDIVDN